MLTAAVQFAATPFNIDRNLEAAERLVRQAAGQGARLVLLPEFFNTGLTYSPSLATLAEDRAGPTLRRLGALSAELDVTLAGGLLMREAGRVCSVLALVEPTGRLHLSARQHRLLWERACFRAGAGPRIANTGLGRLGLIAGADVLQPAAWRAFAGRVDAVLLAAAAPRLHRAVLNFPLGRKAYLAQLMPALLRRRDDLDSQLHRAAAHAAAVLGVPVIHAALCGPFVTQLPRPRLSLLACAIASPRHWPLISQARLATLRASFNAGSAIFDPHGQTLAEAPAGEVLALATLDLPAPPPSDAPAPLPRVSLPWQLRLLDRLLPA